MMHNSNSEKMGWVSFPGKLREKVAYASKITAITGFKVTQGHHFRYQSKAHMQLPVSE